MLKEEICTYEVCKLARDKGFPQVVRRWLHDVSGVKNYYTHDGILNGDCIEIINCRLEKREISDEFDIIAAPTQNQLHKWLQDIKGVDIIVPCIDGKYNYVVQGNINYKCAYEGFSSYKLALEDAFKYTLKNLKMIYEQTN